MFVCENWDLVGNTSGESADLAHFLKASNCSNTALHFLDDVIKGEIQVNLKSFLLKTN